MESDKQKAKEILKKRDLAAKGIEPEPPSEDAEENTEEREKKLAENWLAAGLGLKRSG